MSCTLYARIAPKTEWPWRFKMTLRDKLREKFGDVITSGAASYLEGLRDACGDKSEALALQEMIDALYDDNDIELRYEC